MFYFLDNSIWIGYGKFLIERGEYLSSGVNVLTNGLEIWNITKRAIFQLNFPHSDETMG